MPILRRFRGASKKVTFLFGFFLILGYDSPRDLLLSLGVKLYSLLDGILRIRRKRLAFSGYLKYNIVYEEIVFPLARFDSIVHLHCNYQYHKRVYRSLVRIRANESISHYRWCICLKSLLLHVRMIKQWITL